MKKAVLFLVVIGVMAYGAFLSFNYSPTKSNATASNTTDSKSAEPYSTISSAILPHLDSASAERQKLLSEIKSKTMPSRIILVSADHKSAGAGDISIYPSDWQSQNGKLKLDKDLYDNIVSSGYAISDANAFSNEPGISNIASDIYQAFPRSNFTSLIVKDTVSQEKILQLADFISQGDPEAMIIASVDLSENNQRALANVHDAYSIKALNDLKTDEIWQAETDSSGSLLFAAEFAKNNSQNNFHLFSRGNSADASKDDSSASTGYVLGYYDAQTPEALPQKSTSFVVAGDVMFDRNVWHNFKDIGLSKVFDNFGTGVFHSTDIALLNNEGPISATAINDDYNSGSMVFDFPPETPDVLKLLGVKEVSLANNHSSNAGAGGFTTTKSMLKNAGIAYFGQQNGFDADQSVYRVDGDVPVSIIGIDTLSTYNDKTVQAAIKKEKADGRFVMVYPHWGTEYQTTHSSSQESLAKGWISAGAGLIIGSHPHVVQDFQVINKVPVVYSLGNFVFDQQFSDDTQHGLIMAGNISEDKITLTFQPTKQVQLKPQILQGAEKKAAIAKIFDLDSAAGFVKISSDTIEISLR